MLSNTAFFIMSWFFIICGHTENVDKIRLSTVLPNCIHNFELPSICVWAGGIKDTCQLVKTNIDNVEQFNIICGNGIIEKNNHFSLMEESDWLNIFICKKNIHNLDGSFVVVSLYNRKINIIPDRVGTRFFYLAKFKNSIIISSRLDFISNYCELKSIDIQAFSSLWLLQNQIGTDSLIINIKKYIYSIEIDLDNLNLKENNYTWKPRIIKNIKAEDILNLLCKYSKIKIPINKELSLSMSGGLDSRFILAIMLFSKAEFDTHTFGNETNKDIIIARNIANHFALKFKAYPEILNIQSDILIKKLKEFITKTTLSMPASEYIYKRNYINLYNANKVIIDAGFGEIIRNGLYYRIELNWRKLIERGNIISFIDLLRAKKADIFKDDFYQLLESKVIEQFENLYLQINNLFESLYSKKPNSKADFRNWLDIFSIYIKHLNYCAIEQARIDEEVINFTPFLQPTFLDYVFSLPFTEKNNGMLVRNYIKKNFYDLTKFPLVKNDILYPFSLNQNFSKLYIRIKEKFIPNSKINDKIILLEQLKEFINDSILSMSFKQFEFYNHKVIVKLVNNFYNGEKELVNQMDWFLSFELFRQELME